MARSSWDTLYIYIYMHRLTYLYTTCFGLFVHLQGGVTNRYCIFLSRIPPCRRSRKAVTCRRLKTCLYIMRKLTVSLLVRLYTYIYGDLFLLLPVHLLLLLPLFRIVTAYELEDRGSISIKFGMTGFFSYLPLSNLVSGPPSLLSNGCRRLFQPQ